MGKIHVVFPSAEDGRSASQMTDLLSGEAKVWKRRFNMADYSSHVTEAEERSTEKE